MRVVTHEAKIKQEQRKYKTHEDGAPPVAAPSSWALYEYGYFVSIRKCFSMPTPEPCLQIDKLLMWRSEVDAECTIAKA